MREKVASQNRESLASILGPCRGTPVPCNAESLEALEKGWVQEE